MEIELEIELKKSYQNPSQRFVRFRTGLSLDGDLDGTLGVSMLLRIGRIRKYVSIHLTTRRVFSTLHCRCSRTSKVSFTSGLHSQGYRDSMSAKNHIKSKLN